MSIRIQYREGGEGRANQRSKSRDRFAAYLPPDFVPDSVFDFAPDEIPALLGTGAAGHDRDRWNLAVGLRRESPKRVSDALGAKDRDRHILPYFPYFASLLVLFALCGCSLSSSKVSSISEASSLAPDRDEIRLAQTNWDEDVALSSLAEVILEDDLGYEVRITRVKTAEEALDGVAAGDYDAFQSVWRPQQDGLIEARQSGLNLTDRWLYGTTRASLAVPDYVGVRKMGDLKAAGVRRALVLSRDASGLGAVPEKLLKRYDLSTTVYPSTTEMMKEVDRLYRKEEPFVMLAYSPHWMNLRYQLDYIEGEPLLQDFNHPANLSSVYRAGLTDDARQARALIGIISLTEFQLESLELSIQSADSPRHGAQEWVEQNQPLVDRWVAFARSRGDS